MTPVRLIRMAYCILALAVAVRAGAAEPLRIMPLGDSITVGYTDNPAWNHPFEFGYRSGLYTRLTSAGYDFQFVGSSTEPAPIFGDPTHGGTVSPTIDLRQLSQNGNRGYGAAFIPWLTSQVAGWLAADDPDVILMMIGINGISASSPGQLETLVSTIVAAKPEAHLVVAQITPLSSYNQHLFDYNTYIRETLVPAQALLGNNVSTVDMYSLFLTDPVDPTSVDGSRLSNGINHPTNALYDQMAEVWFNEIRALAVPEPAAIVQTISCLLGLLSWRAGRRLAAK